MKPMLACAPKIDSETGLPKLKFPLVFQPKFDGIRAVVKDGKLYSRKLKLIPNKEIQDALGHPDFEGLDGELIVGDPAASDCYRKTASFVMAPNKVGENWTFWVFDKWNSDRTYLERVQQLLEQSAWPEQWPMATRLPLNGSCMLIMPDTVNSHEELEQMETQLLAAGHEGVILRDPSGLYKFGRGTATKGELIKLKRFTDFEAEIVGVYEEQHNANEAKTDALGRTERSSHQENKIGKGTLGGFILKAINGPFKDVEFRCGTGFDREQRQKFWQNWHGTPIGPERYRARVAFGSFTVKVKSFDIGAKDKPRHPVFLGFRDMEVDG